MAYIAEGVSQRSPHHLYKADCLLRTVEQAAAAPHQGPAPVATSQQVGQDCVRMIGDVNYVSGA
jgi:hypothetical protein